MKRVLFASTLLLIVASATQASACHRYRVWHYHFPQSCGYTHTHQLIHTHRIRQRSETVAKSILVLPLSKSPVRTDRIQPVPAPLLLPLPPPQDERTKALEELRLKLLQ